MDEPMTTCPVCFGERVLDFRDQDAQVAEHHSDAELDEWERQGFVRNVGIVTCDTCEGAGEITVRLDRDLAAYWRAKIDQAIAQVEAERV